MEQPETPPVSPALGRSEYVWETKSIAWHAFDFIRNVVLPSLGLVWIGWDIVAGTVTLFDIVLFLVFLYFTGMGLTVGLHRYFSHRSFECTRSVRYLLAVLGSMTWQRSLFMWAARHRLHHTNADEAGDYHSPHCYFDGQSIPSRFLQWLHSYYYWLHVADPTEETIVPLGVV
jgi:stearoyl-CoA desaturase (Delta-9 desaturase)